MKYGDYTDEACRNPEAKRDTRERPINLLRDHACTLWSRSRNALRCDWLELAGHHAPTLTLLRQQGALDAGARFIGVDHDIRTIDDCRQHHADAPAVWIHSDLRAVLEGERYMETVARVGVLVFDSHTALYAKNVEQDLHPMFEFARRQQGTLNEFLLVLNLVADIHATQKKRRKDMDRYLDILSRGLGAQVSADDVHGYTSNVATMQWVALRYGF